MKLVEPVIYEKFKQSGQLPSISGVVLSIVKLLQCDDYKMDDLIRLVQSDPAIAGMLLKFSNAASYGHSRPIVSLSKAIIALGTLRVRVLVLALSVLNNHRVGKCSSFDYARYWSRALATAISAQALASHAKISPEEGFTAGLLSSVGELALVSIFPERYAEMIFLPETAIQKRLSAESEAFGTNHRELTATLLLGWGLPEVLVTAIYQCEQPDEAGFLEGSRVHNLTLSLHVAASLANICVAEDSARWTMLPKLYSKAARLGINTDELSSIADGVIERWHDLGETLKIQTCEIVSFAEMLASSQPREQGTSVVKCSWPNTKSALLICMDSTEFDPVSGYLNTNGYTVNRVFDPTDGLEMALELQPDLIMIEISECEVDGQAFCKALRGESRGREAYIILVVNHADTGLLTRSLEMGADDILLHPGSELMLHTKLRGACKIIQLKKELISERNGLVNFAGEWAGANRRLIHVAMTDPLTHLSNRRYGLDFLANEWAFAFSNNLPLSCLMIDVDHFKKINDQYGHKGGDAVLVKLAGILQSDARCGDLVFRYGGEEFCIICPGAPLETSFAVAERIRQNVAAQRFQIGDKDIAVTISVGVAVMVQTQIDEAALIHDADVALYSAKETGRNRVVACANA
jgi:diguanylate cyclase (GGDEF)-like protein